MSWKQALVLTVLVGCADDIDPQWQLDHDRVIAVRATPPRVPAGGSSEIDALLGHKGAPPDEAVPELATIVSPDSLAGVLTHDANHWIVTAPDEAQLAMARTGLGLADGAAVPVVVGVSYASGTLTAIKTVYLGEAADNPVLDSAMIDGVASPAATALTVGAKLEVPLAVTVDETDDVNWLTSCGTMHDFDLPAAYLRVEADDPQVGDLAVVVRTQLGGVAWRVWPIHAE